MPIEYLDGVRFRRALVAGANWVRYRREHLNHINVFPVPDGDTGTNLALSLLATVEGVEAVASRSLADVTAAAAESSVLGAKGNSGVIMAHWFIGLSRAFGGVERAGIAAVGEALASAADTVCAAIESPVEGTVITVMRAGGRSAAAHGMTGTGIDDLLRVTCTSAEEALARTPEQLPVLARNNVVDAGAQGFVDFLHGIQRAARGQEAPADDSPPAMVSRVAAAAEDFAGRLADGPPGLADPLAEGGRYCTEIVVRGRAVDERRLRSALLPLGSSLLIAGAGAVVKVHLHTDRPDAVIARASRFGEVIERKVDDMQRQRMERHRSLPPLIALERQPSGVALLCDSTADLPESIRRDHGIELTPLQILFGDEVYRDQVDLSTQEFYQRLLAGPHHPTTSQPAPRAFVESLARIRADREAIVVTLSATLCGTHESARRAAALAAQPRVEVFDSASVSLGLGLMVLNAARLAATGASVSDILDWLGRWRSDTGAVFSVASLEFLRRGGRIGRVRSLVADLLGVRPVLGLRDGQLAAIGRVRSEGEAIEQVVAEVARSVEPGGQIRLGLVAVDQVGGAREVEAALRQRYEVIESVQGAPTGVIGAHVGPGAWGVFYQRVRSDDPLAPGG